MDGVSFVVPVRNGAATIVETLESIFMQSDGRELEVVVVDDRSTDATRKRLEQYAEKHALSILIGEGRGAAAAINMGLRAVRYSIVCQVDQDVTLKPGWLRSLVEALNDPTVAAAQGYYETDPGASLPARLMGIDLEQRYEAIGGGDTDHACTGNTAYRLSALRTVGLFDESLGYGYDNDMSYRLRAAGYRLTIRTDARSRHRWRDGLWGYLAQQYGFGYGRLDLVAKHPSRLGGDTVSPAAMMLHAPAMAFACGALATAGVLAIAHGPWALPAAFGATVVLLLTIERGIAGARAAYRFRSLTPLAFPLFHLARDLAWTAAIVRWAIRRVLRSPSQPSHSMSPRGGSSNRSSGSGSRAEPARKGIPSPARDGP
jgi:hypothetical protein